MKGPATLLPLLLLLVSATASFSEAAGVTPEVYSDQQQPLKPAGGFANTVPAFPVVQTVNRTACRLDLSNDLFGGVEEACGGGRLDRARCCPVLAAWLYAAHARSSLEVGPEADDVAGDVGPVMPDDSQLCVDSLQDALEGRGVRLPPPNATCDVVICFCGIRLHQIGSLTCPAAFNVSATARMGGARSAAPTALVRDLEKHCRNASYAGCTRCLQSVQKLKGGGGGDDGSRASRMFGRDCELMGLTWLLARNRTLYIPTVSAVLRAVLYGGHPPAHPYTCSSDKENMPVAVDSLHFRRIETSTAGTPPPALHISLYSLPVLFLSSIAFAPHLLLT